MKSLAALRLADIVTRRILGIATDCPLSAAARRMGETRVSCLAVMDGVRPVGIITERALLELLHRRPKPESLAGDVMHAPVITAPLDLDFHSAYRMLRQHGIRHLLAVDAEGGLVGVATATDFRLHLGLDGFRRIHGLRTIVDPVTAAVPPETPLAEVLERMVRDHWDHVLAVADQQPVGILTERDIPLLLAAEVDPSEIQLREVMSTPVQSISATATVADASARMARLHIRHLAVVSESQRLVGMLSQDSLLEKLGIEVVGGSEDGSTYPVGGISTAEERLASVLEATGTGTWEWTPSLDCCTCSLITARMLGCPEGWQPASLGAWTERIHPDDRGLFLATLEAAKAMDRPVAEIMLRLRRQEGNWLTVRARLRAMQSPSRDETVRIVATIAEMPG